MPLAGVRAPFESDASRERRAERWKPHLRDGASGGVWKRGMHPEDAMRIISVTSKPFITFSQLLEWLYCISNSTYYTGRKFLCIHVAFQRFRPSPGRRRSRIRVAGIRQGLQPRKGRPPAVDVAPIFRVRECGPGFLLWRPKSHGYLKKNHQYQISIALS